MEFFQLRGNVGAFKGMGDRVNFGPAAIIDPQIISFGCRKNKLDRIWDSNLLRLVM